MRNSKTFYYVDEENKITTDGTRYYCECCEKRKKLFPSLAAELEAAYDNGYEAGYLAGYYEDSGYGDG